MLGLRRNFLSIAAGVCLTSLGGCAVTDSLPTTRFTTRHGVAVRGILVDGGVVGTASVVGGWTMREARNLKPADVTQPGNSTEGTW